jgi:2-keto-4-pentenoate hydratase/2-oxohepta-3-ene-1,7-dioic acid hydratase in catechol pathway
VWALQYEAELAVVIGVRCRGVRAEDVPEVVAGYTCANDLTAYARQQPDTPSYPLVWAKHFDGCTPIGPWLATDLDPSEAEITCRVDGDVRQRASTRELIRPVQELIPLVSEHMTLMPGDVLLTGSPAGSGPILAGSVVEVAISGIGTLRNVIGEPTVKRWSPDDGDDNSLPALNGGHRLMERRQAADAGKD